MAEHAMDTDEAAGLLERWRQTEPLRLWLYGTAVPLLLALVGYGVLSDAHSALWLAVLQAGLLGAGTEAARQYVVAPATARAVASASVRAAWGLAPEDSDEEVHETARHALIHYRIP